MEKAGNLLSKYMAGPNSPKGGKEPSATTAKGETESRAGSKAETTRGAARRGDSQPKSTPAPATAPVTSKFRPSTFVDEDARHRRRRPARATDLVLIKSILAKALAHKGLEKKISRYEFVLHWREIVGEGFDIVCKPECLSRNTLIVRVINSGWAQELGFQKPMILERLAQFLPAGERVNEMMFRVGPL